MTIGQRIAQKRKEQGLSQEALGNRLGVSRQSIYKWESDAALPEIDKLIALSRLFSVSVGWLLGVEEPPPETAEAGADSELTEQQLNMVEEIVGRYLASQPKPLSPRRRLVLKITAAAAAVCLVWGLYTLSSQLDQLSSRYAALQNSVNNITSSVDSQVNALSNRVEEILEAQNSLLTDSGVEITGADLRTQDDAPLGTVRFSAYAVPKTYVEGMTAEFLLDNGTGGVIAVPAEFLSSGQTFRADAISCALTDDITLSVAFRSPDGTRQTQPLEYYDYLLTASLPSLNLERFLERWEVAADSFVPREFYICLREFPSWYQSTVGGVFPPASIREVQVGLFRNQTLVAWAEPCTETPDFLAEDAEPGARFYRLPPEAVPVGPEDTFSLSALVTDTQGRRMMYTGEDFTVDTQQRMTAWRAPLVSPWTDPAQWTF